jgi:hypothetical protein
MKIIDKIIDQITEIRQRFGRLLMMLLFHGEPCGAVFTLSQSLNNLINAPPGQRRWYGSGYRLWRLEGKPVPIRTTRFRRT